MDPIAALRRPQAVLLNPYRAETQAAHPQSTHNAPLQPCSVEGIEQVVEFESHARVGGLTTEDAEVTEESQKYSSLWLISKVPSPLGSTTSLFTHVIESTIF